MMTMHEYTDTETQAAAFAGGRQPARWSRLRCAALAMTLGMVTAIITVAYVAFAAGSVDSRTFVALIPFVIPAALVGVAPPAYVALDLGRRNLWLQAAAATSAAALVAFVVFWSAVIVTTPGPVAVRMATSSVVVINHFDRAQWLAHPADRHDMVQDLIDSGRLKGLATSQVIAELGQPPRVEVRAGMRTLRYPVGTVAGKSLLFDVLVGADGRVRKTELVASE